LQNPGQTNGDDLNSVKSGNRIFTNKKREYLLEEINEVETNNNNNNNNSKNNIRDLHRGMN
jgi:hypothetical protein